MTDQTVLLSQLRDVHLPPSEGWWPPAWGWWLLLALLLALIAGAVWVTRHRARQIAQYNALSALNQLERQYQQQPDTAAFMAGASRLLRQCALTWFPERNPGGLMGMEWLQFLDETAGNKTIFTTSTIGAALLTAPYSAASEVDVAAVSSAVRRWLHHAGQRRNKMPRQEAPC